VKTRYHTQGTVFPTGGVAQEEPRGGGGGKEGRGPPGSLFVSDMEKKDTVSAREVSNNGGHGDPETEGICRSGHCGDT